MSSPPFAAVALLSAAVLGYEILLMRLFSIILWHHFAYMMISVAMLGYGAAGTFVALAQRALLRRYEIVFVAAAVSFGITAVAGFLLAQRVEFNPLEMLWDPRQPLRLLFIYALLFVPFFCAATSICLSFARFADQPHRLYSFDILGAGAGSLGILAALFATTTTGALQLIGALGLAAAALAAFHDKAKQRWLPALLLGVALLLGLGLPTDWIRLRPSEFKDLSQTLSIRGTRLIAEHSSPIALIDVVESSSIPFRHAPGLSLNATVEPPPQMGLFIDGDGPSALTRYDGQTEPLEYLDYVTSALPYHLLQRPRVLVLGAGGGADVLQALYHRASAIDAVELNSQVLDLVEHQFADYSGRPYSAPTVRAHLGEARGFVAGHGERYDLIQVALLDAFGTSSAGLHALSESYLYTVEALDDYVNHLEPGGLLAITRWVNLPPRDVLKLFGTAALTLERRGVAQPAQQLALIRGWKTATLVVKNGAFTRADLAALKDFCRARSFDVAYYPGIGAAETNRFNVLPQSYFHDGALALLGPERQEFFDRYKFNIVPATDDKPFFFHFFKWRTLPELVALKEQGGLPLLEWGYPVLVATLAQAVVASLVLILLPLWITARGTDQRDRAGWTRLRIAAYFTAIGFAFMFIEIAFIQKFLLFLSHPLYAVAVVLCAFLVFAGVGSSYSGRSGTVCGAAFARRVAWPVAGIAVLASLYLVVLPALFRPLMPLADGFKILISLGLIAPLAFAMGMPFPMGLARVADRTRPLVPWAWGINACASVVAAIIATLLAIHVGFGAVVLVAVCLYALAAAAYR
ncbi:MAG TPA: SAM-dependent methyltransferase [Casimicrobiaceae bacterium]|nr:SAM-dependent methyltransferase [Casimicrobiaceae bacterium]